MTVTIEASGLSKQYRIGDPVATTVADAVSGLWHRQRVRPSYVWALREVGFEIHDGEVVGIIGRNGAGKSTLLKILARITDPTAGRGRTLGRVGALLEVGTAFHAELTGRENIKINGALLGMTRADIRRRFDEIVEFSGVERFLDTPLKRYSSGMHLRLAFAVAAHFEPEIVVVDEVLAVGDAEFQHRCLGKMSEFGREGRTVIFVSHDLGAIGRLCTRTMWLDAGSIRDDDRTETVLARYYAETVPATTVHTPVLDAAADSAPVRLHGIALTDASGVPVESPVRGEALRVELALEVCERLTAIEVAVWIVNEDGLRIVDESLLDQRELAGRLDRPGAHLAALIIPPVLPAGSYTLGVWLGSYAGTISDREILRFRVAPRTEDPSEMSRRPRLASPAATWSVAHGRGA